MAWSSGFRKLARLFKKPDKRHVLLSMWKAQTFFFFFQWEKLRGSFRKKKRSTPRRNTTLYVSLPLKKEKGSLFMKKRGEKRELFQYVFLLFCCLIKRFRSSLIKGPTDCLLPSPLSFPFFFFFFLFSSSTFLPLFAVLSCIRGSTHIHTHTRFCFQRDTHMFISG